MDVPPYLAKSILPWPFHFLLRIDWLASLVKWFTDIRHKIKFKTSWYPIFISTQYSIRIALKRYFILRLLKTSLVTYLLASVFYDQYTAIVQPALEKVPAWLAQLATSLYSWLQETAFVIITDNLLVKLVALCVLLLLFPLGRNILFAILRSTNLFLKLIPGKQTFAILGRYTNIVRFANYKDQFRVYDRLKKQYPPGTKFIVLPMDMRYMDAGRPVRDYYEQMSMLATIKRNHEEVYPFVFIDPRRMKEDGEKFFRYRIENNQVVLEDCLIKTYIEKEDFAGFKIYPALGYYPFDERLLPLWKYAADNGIPIMTHCIRGVIYYRGSKKKDWDRHPVFRHAEGSPLMLPQMKPVDVQEIFTHPLNYAVLYKEALLAEAVGKAKDTRVKQLFGYHTQKVPVYMGAQGKGETRHEEKGFLQRGLCHLKLCFGHFGGEDEWKRFFEQDRNNYGHQLINNPNRGIEILTTEEGEFKPGRPIDIWENADWYSIICSLMLQHPNIYADISYILHGDLEILPLLRHTMKHPILQTRVLYGSDFFVVRNHKSEKNMLADMMGGLLPQEFDLIARKNPVNYLKKG
ncbi:hypothetical protein BW716_34825 [[Flexibacter] sp. ATCC 35208]|nr:hypothetical protein BW716_34825 [[Flexibacter] sp. ATCC 35208]